MFTDTTLNPLGGDDGSGDVPPPSPILPRPGGVKTGRTHTFSDAQRNITQHYSKPHVHPVEILPIMPDYDMWKYPCAQVIFDSDPAPPPGALARTGGLRRDGGLTAAMSVPDLSRLA